MTNADGYAGDILRVDLTTRSVDRVPTRDISGPFVGGRGLAVNAHGYSLLRRFHFVFRAHLDESRQVGVVSRKIDHQVFKTLANSTTCHRDSIPSRELIALFLKGSFLE